jgi:hypothetical protein
LREGITVAHNANVAVLYDAEFVIVTYQSVKGEGIE